MSFSRNKYSHIHIHKNAVFASLLLKHNDSSTLILIQLKPTNVTNFMCIVSHTFHSANCIVYSVCCQINIKHTRTQTRINTLKYRFKPNFRAKGVSLGCTIKIILPIKLVLFLFLFWFDHSIFNNGYILYLSNMFN